MLTQSIYNTIIRKDFILKVLPETINEIPTINKLEVRIIFPKIIDDFSKLYDGIIYLEELTGQLPINKILSVKRVGAHDYEKAIVITSTLRKTYFWNFLLFFSIALIFYWVEMRNVLFFKSSIDPQNKIIQLINKDFFYFFNMPIEYDDRQFEWNLQFLFFFEKENKDLNIELLSCFLRYFFFYDLLALPTSTDLNSISEIESDDDDENNII
jgi:hypothetical protein